MLVQITIDGPGGVGKSVLSRELAKSLGYLSVNTGLIFRGLSWYILNHSSEGLSIPEILSNLQKEKKFIFDKNIWFLNGKPIPNNQLISPEVTKHTIKIAADYHVRQYVLVIEREVGKHYNIVMEGRDIGTAVFPNAILKIYLTASLDVRSQRRYKELKEKNLITNETLDDIKKSIEIRDEEDKNRKLSPLVKPKDAVTIWNDDKTIEELVDEIKKLLEERLAKQQILHHQENQ